MAIVNGKITRDGPVIDVLIGVPKSRANLLAKNGFPVPPPIALRVIIDTGSHGSGFAPWVFEKLDLTPIGKITILTPSTRVEAPHECDEFHVSLSLVADGEPRPFGDRVVINPDCWHHREEIVGLIGRDILAHCNFFYFGKDREFKLAFG